MVAGWMLKVLATSEMDFSFLDEPAGEDSLFLVHLFGPTETNSASFCFCATGPSALPNQIAMETHSARYFCDTGLVSLFSKDLCSSRNLGVLRRPRT
jgi:hypothetical protein